MFDPERLLGQMLGQGLGLGPGGRGKRRKGHGYRSGSMVGKAQLGVGLLGVAIAAWEHYQGQQKAGAASPAAASPPPPPVPGVSAMPPPPPAGLAATTGAPAAAAGARPPPLMHPSRADAEHLLRTMVAAASADGEVDAAERAAILGQAREAGGAGDDLAWLERELAAPLSVESIVDATRGGLRESTYAAAVAALDVDVEAERRWLQRLAEGLRLTPSERDAIERAVAASREA